MEEQQRQQLQKYLDMVYRRKIMIMAFLFLAIIAGLGVYLKTAKVYESTALLIYQRARINPGSTMTPDVQTQTREMVATLTQQVTSRTSLESLIKQFSLYEQMREKLPMEDVVDAMRRHIIIKPERGDVFKVTYTGADPKKVMQVANAVAARFIEENLRYREEKATETSAYVQDELNLSKNDLDKKEAAMRDYKLKFYNEMPQQFEANMSRLTSLQEQSQKNRDSSQDLERTKVLIQEQISRRKEALALAAVQARLTDSAAMKSGISSGQVERNPVLAQSLEELSAVNTALENLLLRYTDKHPEVRRLKKKQEQLEEEQKKLVASLEKDEGSVASQEEKAESPSEVKEDFSVQDTQLQELNMQMKQINYARKRLGEESDELQTQIEQYKKWIEMTPAREAEWTALTRDYKQLYDHYQRLVVRNLEAVSAESLERRQKGSQFKIVDSAYFPEKPTKPDFKKIMALSVALGLGLGGALAFLLEMKDSSFRSPVELERFLGVTVLCALPHVFTVKEKRANKFKSLGWVLAFSVVMVCILGGMAFLYKSGRIII